jgi:hypothetical protein
MDAAALGSSWGVNSIDGEVLSAAMSFDRKLTWRTELLHAASACMTFKTQALVLLGRPTLVQNNNGELHNDEGPAVVYLDGAKQYWLDGHALGALGQKIVEAPETLTIDDISGERNEEVKRLAIEAFGWSRYLDAVQATVLDRRQNDVDNTIEALVRIPEQIERWEWDHAERKNVSRKTTIYTHKLVLACRSTARQYFLNVPDDIATCEAGQKWLHEGANDNSIDVMNYPVRLLGAS